MRAELLERIPESKRILPVESGDHQGSSYRFAVSCSGKRHSPLRVSNPGRVSRKRYKKAGGALR
jgi:hypothetical protein